MHRARVARLSFLFWLTVGTSSAVQAQTFSVIHNFSGVQDGANPAATLTVDASGNLYGTTYAGGSFAGRDCAEGGCGLVFRMARHNSAWVLSPLYTFTGVDDGAGPASPVIFGPGGLLYGTAEGGGDGSCTNGYFLGCGVVFKLQPRTSALCSWMETPVYQFSELTMPGSGDCV